MKRTLTLAILYGDERTAKTNPSIRNRSPNWRKGPTRFKSSPRIFKKMRGRGGGGEGEGEEIMEKNDSNITFIFQLKFSTSKYKILGFILFFTWFTSKSHIMIYN